MIRPRSILFLQRFLLQTSCIAVLFSIAFSTLVFAEEQSDFLKGRTALLENDFQTAAQHLEKAAKDGHPLAQSDLGSLYYEGKGVRQDYTKATKWFLEAALQGDAYAQKKLGNAYALGHGVQKDPKEDHPTGTIRYPTHSYLGSFVQNEALLCSKAKGN